MSTYQLEIDFIEKHLPDGHSCHWVDSVPSTQSAVEPNSLLIAEHQSAGVGRRGKNWITPKGRSVCFSYRFELPLPVTQMRGYQMTTALAVVESIHTFEPEAAVQLKWPNDLYHDGQKFAGILIHLIPKQQNTEVIVGVGINWQLTEQQMASVDQPICNMPLTQLAASQTPSRHAFIAQLLRQISDHNQRFVRLGLADFLSRWQDCDYLLQQTIAVTSEQQQQLGEYQGINSQGELLLQTPQGIKTFSSGEVSVKAL